MPPRDPDLTDTLIAVVVAHRDVINASRIALGESGRVEIHVNPSMASVSLVVLVEARRAA
jgi:hypothetical protein